MKVEVSKRSKIILLIAAIVVGILFCALGIKLFNVLFTIIGGLMVLGAAYSLINRNLLSGIISGVFGVVLIVLTWTVPNVVYIIFGLMVLISAILTFVVSIIYEDVKNCIISGLNAVLGGFLIGYREGVDWMIYVIGALFIVLGALGLILVLIPSKKGVKTVDVKDVK